MGQYQTLKTTPQQRKQSTCGMKEKICQLYSDEVSKIYQELWLNKINNH